MRTTSLVLLLALSAMVLTVSSAPAGARQAGPCRQDIQKFCPDAKPGGGAFRDCLEQHKAELSPACQARISEAKSRIADWRKACGADVQKVCSDVIGPRNLRQCLNQHRDQLSQSCQDQLAQHPGRQRQHQPGAPAPQG